ncbi:MAG: hydrogenase nickel incorporation protein HypB [Dehalococcoidia bacterium]|nr:hydrogenase nickel incorporation protein HypB [Dehalococcoidia bacterium]
MQVKVLRDILSANERIAMKNRRLFDEKGVFAINLMSSPGAGKTSLILETIRKLKDRVKIAVIEGDIASSLDAEKISKENVTALQINTGGSCHLDANMINNALESMSLEGTDLLIIENVGNLICPAEFALGVHRKVMISSIPEGDDKPYKYPLMFSEADAVLINKIDLLPYVEFDIANFSRGVRALNPRAKIIEVSCKTGQGIDNWVSWLSSQMKT